MAQDIRTRMIEILPRLRRFSYALTGNLDDADDLVQDACARALASASQWQADTRLDSWMYRIAQNLWLDKLRAAKVRGQSVDMEQAEQIPGSDGRDVSENQLTLQAVSRSISKLPADQQLVIAHVCIDGRSYKDAAEALGIPIGTVMSRLARARSALHEALIAEGAPLPQTSEALGANMKGGPHARPLR